MRNQSYSDTVLHSQAHRADARAIDSLLALTVLLVLSPVMVLNCVVSSVKLKSPFKREFEFKGIEISYLQFQDGFFKDALVLLHALFGRNSLVDESHISRKSAISPEDARIQNGLFNIADLRSLSGIKRVEEDTYPTRRLSAVAKLGLVIRYLLCLELYGQSDADYEGDFELFGVRVNNETLDEAIDEVVVKAPESQARVFFFINVNSINQARQNPAFAYVLNSSHKSYADGSGLRVGASRIGATLKDNLNGTDLFPLICEKAQEQGKSIFFLGAEPGVAQAAADWSSQKYANLKIAGVQHGFFNESENDRIVADINASQADILLVAMGSPVQERWLLANKSKLHCSAALAVGGLFDFYSGRIARAPLWLRELGMEWIWRLYKEPVKKFNRYVIGNPWYMFSLFKSPPTQVGRKLNVK